MFKKLELVDITYVSMVNSYVYDYFVTFVVMKFLSYLGLLLLKWWITRVLSRFFEIC